MFFSVHQYCSDLLIQKEENTSKESRKESHKDQPPIGHVHGVHHPASVWSCRLQNETYCLYFSIYGLEEQKDNQHGYTLITPYLKRLAITICDLNMDK